jgi:hypothetical protein
MAAHWQTQNPSRPLLNRDQLLEVCLAATNETLPESSSVMNWLVEWWGEDAYNFIYEELDPFTPILKEVDLRELIEEILFTTAVDFVNGEGRQSFASYLPNGAAQAMLHLITWHYHPETSQWPFYEGVHQFQLSPFIANS